MVKFVQFDHIVEKSQLNTFLKTSLNTELVITILKGILILAASSSDKIDHMDDQDLYKIKQTTTIELREIKIRNAAKFTLNEEGDMITQANEESDEEGTKKILETDSDAGDMDSDAEEKKDFDNS